MGKVSIGLKGWRFDEDAVFDEHGQFRPLDDLDEDTRTRLVRLQALRGNPCDCCWLVHGDEELNRCNPAEVVYGEPLAEVLLCESHVPDFSYWYLEDGGDAYRGTEEFQDRFHEWFAAGNRAPEGYEGIEHAETAPEEVPEPDEVDPEAFNVPLPAEEQERIDVREIFGLDEPSRDAGGDVDATETAANLESVDDLTAGVVDEESESDGDAEGDPNAGADAGDEG